MTRQPVPATLHPMFTRRAKKSWDQLTGLRRDQLQEPLDRIRAYGFDKPEPLDDGASRA